MHLAYREGRRQERITLPVEEREYGREIGKKKTSEVLNLQENILEEVASWHTGRQHQLCRSSAPGSAGQPLDSQSEGTPLWRPESRPALLLEERSPLLLKATEDRNTRRGAWTEMAAQPSSSRKGSSNYKEPCSVPATHPLASALFTLGSSLSHSRMFPVQRLIPTFGQFTLFLLVNMKRTVLWPVRGTRSTLEFSHSFQKHVLRICCSLVMGMQLQVSPAKGTEGHTPARVHCQVKGPGCDLGKKDQGKRSERPEAQSGCGCSPPTWLQGLARDRHAPLITPETTSPSSDASVPALLSPPFI